MKMKNIENAIQSTRQASTKKGSAQGSEFIPIVDKVLYQYAEIDENGILTLNAACLDNYNPESIFIISKKLQEHNFYVDRNYFEILVADPVLKTQYYLHNIYYIENGYIYVAGITAKAGFEGEKPRFYKNLMLTALAFDWHFNKFENKFHYDITPILSAKFNPNYFSQTPMLEIINKYNDTKNLYSKLSEKVISYDRPANYMQRKFFMYGAETVQNYSLKIDDYKKIVTLMSGAKKETEYDSKPVQISDIAVKQKNPAFSFNKSKTFSNCYFSFENFYLSGMNAAINYYNKF